MGVIKTILIGIVGLFTLSFIFSIYGDISKAGEKIGGTSTPTTPPTTTTPPKATPAPDVTKPTSQPKQTVVQPQKTFKIGDIVSNGKIAVSVNSMRFEKAIYTQGYTQWAKERNKFLILDVTVWNVGKTTAHVNPLYTTVADENGFTYNFDGGTMYLPKAFDAIDLQPGRKIRGELAYQIPKDSTPNEFIYSPFLSPTITINLVQ